MAENPLQQFFNMLSKNPEDIQQWIDLAAKLTPNNRSTFILFLQQNALVLKEFLKLIDTNPKIIADFKISLQEMDALEPFIANLKNLESMFRNSSDVVKEKDIAANKQESSYVPEKAMDKSTTLNDIDADLKEIFEIGESPITEDRDNIQKQLEEITNADENARQQRENEYKDLVKKANSKLYSYDEKDIDEVIENYKKALIFYDGTSMDWYNLAQAFLKRAQKTAGVFSYSFEGHYKDLSDFYEAMNAAKKAVQIDQDDKTYWEFLTMIYEIMNKKPLALFCAKKTLEMQILQEKRLSISGMLGSTAIQGAAGEILKKKIEDLERETSIPIDPFDLEAVTTWEQQARKEKVSKKLPLDHLELYLEAMDYYHAGDIESTKNLLAKATKIKPNFFEPWIILAAIKVQAAIDNPDRELQQIEFSDVNQCLEKAIEINPDSIEPYKIYAKEYEFLDSRDNFIRVLDKIIELEPENWEYRKKLADVNFEKGLHFHIYGDYMQADNFLHKAIDMYPYDPNPWMWLGKNYILRGNYLEAIKSLKESLRLEEQNPGAKESLVEAFLLQATKRKENKEYDLALKDIDEIFIIDNSNDKAISLQASIVDDYCELGFEAIENGKIKQGRIYFESALGIKEDDPFALIGLARCDLMDQHGETAIMNFNKALDEWNASIINNSDEFVFQAIIDLFNLFTTKNIPPMDEIGNTAEKFKIYIDGFMNVVKFIHGDHVHLGHVYTKLLQFFLNLAVQVNDITDQNAMKVLESFGAATLPTHFASIGDWKNTRGTTDTSIAQARMMAIKDLKFFFDHFFNMFLFKSNNAIINNIIIFINFVRQELSFTIKEIYDTLEFLENGSSVIKAFDQLASYTYQASTRIRTTDASLIKLTKPIVAIQLHPSLNLQAIITKEPKLAFTNKAFQPVESAIFSGKTTRIKPSDVQWSPDGNRLLVTESRLEKRGFKGIMHHGNQIMMLDLTHDPMINPNLNAFDLDPAMLDQQVSIIELDQDTIAIGWKDNFTFQTLLKNGLLIRWMLKEGNFDQKATRLQIAENDIVAASPNQELIAILSLEKKTLNYINVRVDQVYKCAFDMPGTPVCLKWDNESRHAHLLMKNDDGSHSIGFGTKDGQVMNVTTLDDKDLNEDVFEPFTAGQHIFYLLRSGKKLIITEASQSIRLEFMMEIDIQSLIDKGPLNMQWANLKEIRFFIEETLIKLDLTSKMKQMLTDRITFLERFPRETFVNKANFLKDMLSVLG